MVVSLANNRDGALTYLETYSNENTRKSYRKTLSKFFRMIEVEGDDLDTRANNYISQDRDYEADIQKFFIQIKDKTPKTIRHHLSVVKTFFIENGINIEERKWRSLIRRINGKGAVSQVHVPTPDEFRRILTHMDSRKAFFLCLGSSGMRSGEALQLKVADIDLDSDPCRVDIKAEYAKGAKGRIAFISQEAREALVEWLRIRPSYLKTSSARTAGMAKTFKFDYSKEEDDRIFPFSYNNARVSWTLALKKAGLYGRDERTKRLTTTLHTLRKLFRSEMTAAGVPMDVVETLIGHRSYLSDEYRHHRVETLEEAYKKGEYAVTFFGTGNAELEATLRQERDELDQARDGLQNLAISLNAANVRLTDRQAEMQVELKALRHTVEVFQQKVEALHNQLWAFEREDQQHALEDEQAIILESYVFNEDEFNKFTQQARELVE